jgi:phosphate transport system substrate-binding protein
MQVPESPTEGTSTASELLQLLRERRANCRVYLRDDQSEGELLLVDGEVKSAQFGDDLGPPALEALGRCTSLHYRIEPQLSIELAIETEVPSAALLPDAERTNTDEIAAISEEDFEAATYVTSNGESAEQRASPISHVAQDSDAAPHSHFAAHPKHADDALPDAAVERPTPIERAQQESEQGSSAVRASHPPSVTYHSETLDLASWAAQAITGQQTPFAREAKLSTPPPRADLAEPFSRERTPTALVLVVGLFALLGTAALFWSGSSSSGDEAASRGATAADENGISRPPELLAAAEPLIADGTLIPTVLVRTLVDVAGRAQRTEVQTRRLGLAEREAQAAAAARSYRFRPALANGKPVEAWVTLPISFSPKRASRELVIKGSDTLGSSLIPAWVSQFGKREAGLALRVEALGSSTGFAGLLDGTAQIAASSRPIRAGELALAERLGVRLREFVIGYDGIAIIVHRDNAVRELDVDAVAQLFTGRMSRWSDLGGIDQPIRALRRPDYSGTHSFFEERVLTRAGGGARSDAEVESVEASKSLVRRVAGDVHAIGYVSLGQVASDVRALALASHPGAPGILPDHASIRDGSYPIARPLFLYLRADSQRDALAFVDYALSEEGQALIEKSGLIPLASAQQSAHASELPEPFVAPPDVLRLYFDEGSVNISKASSRSLMAAAAALHAGQRALVVGNADGLGDAAVNVRLAERRAAAVLARLKALGAPSQSITVDVVGSEQPLRSNATSGGRSENRRVDVMLTRR